MASLPTSKRGSSRRKGDEFQDLSAMRLILELYIAGANFEVFLEYEKIEAIDDIVIVVGHNIRAVQAKYAIDPLAVYVPDDFTEEGSRTYFGRLANGWKKARKTHPGFAITVELLSNRSRDSALEGIVGPSGDFTTAFVEGHMKKKAKIFREKLKTACAFTGNDAETTFREFLNAFHFHLGQRSLDDLCGYLQGEILDHVLGISDRAVFYEIKELIERHAIDLHEPITRPHLDKIFHAAQRRFLLSQVFPVDTQHFVELTTFGAALLALINATDNGYIVVTGLPGSGKSTSLSEFFDRLSKDARFALCRYYCFVSPNDDMGRLRLEAEALRVNLLTELHRQFRFLLDRQHDYSEHRFAEVLQKLGSTLSSDGRKLVILLDGLDHAERDPLVQESVLRALPTALPEGVVIVVGTQELKNWQSIALWAGREQRHVPIPLFTRSETETFLVAKHSLTLDPKQIDRVHEKSQGLPLYLRYAAEWLREHDSDPVTLEEMPEAGDGDIRNYYDRLWIRFDQQDMSHARHMCGVLAALRFHVRLAELGGFQTAIPSILLPATIQTISHLLRKEEDHVSVFHESFRVFVNSKLDEPTRKAIARDILLKLKTERGSARWFTHIFGYALEAGDADYLLSEVNRQFVDFELQHCRPAEDILAAIDAAAKAGTDLRDLVALARLGSLQFRTVERLEQFDYGMLAKV